MNICPCLDTIYKGRPLRQSLEEIRALGYSGFEFWHCADWDMAELLSLKEALGLQVTNFDAVEVPLTEPGERDRFLREMEAALKAAEALGSPCVTVLSGNDTGKARELQRDSIVAGLKAAAPMLESAGVTAVLEASNRRVNRPCNYLTGADEAFDIIRRVGSGRVRMLYDIYHQQISEGDLLSRILPDIDLIGHFHAAGVPGRHELDRCEINYDYVFRSIDEAGYSRWIGLEYFPRQEPAQGLRDLSRYL